MPFYMKVNKALIPVAGFGTRLLPASKSIPKEMLPIVDRPAILYVLEEIIQAGIEMVVFIQGRGKTAIEDFFDTSFELEAHLQATHQTHLLESIQKIQESIDIVSIRQQKPLGLGHAVYCGKPLLAESPFAVLLPDELMMGSPQPTSLLLSHFEKQGLSVTGLMPVAHEDMDKYGIATQFQPLDAHQSDQVYRIMKLVEKPQKPKILKPGPLPYALPGRYIFTSDIFLQLENLSHNIQGEIQLTEAMQSLAKMNKLLGVCLSNKRYDIGNKWGFLHANIELALHHPEVGPYLKQYLLKIKLKDQ